MNWKSKILLAGGQIAASSAARDRHKDIPVAVFPGRQQPLAGAALNGYVNLAHAVSPPYTGSAAITAATISLLSAAVK